MIHTFLNRLALSYITAFCVLSFPAGAADLTAQFATVKLAYGASISIPKAWKIVRGNELLTIETAAGAAIDLTGYTELTKGVEVLIIARLADPTLYASVTVTSVSMPKITPSLLERMSDAQVKAGEASIRTGIEAITEEKVTEWTALRKQKVGSNLAFCTSYVRSSDAGDTRVYLYKVFGSGRIYDVELSTRIHIENVNRVVLDKIAASFIVP